AASGAQMVQPLEVAALAFPIPDGVIDKIQLRETAKILDREYRRENRLQPGVFAFRWQQIHLQEALIRQPLDLDQVRDLDRTLDLRKVQALPLPNSTISIAMISVFHSLTSRYPKGSGRDARRAHFRHRSGLDTVEVQIPENAASYEFLCAHVGARARRSRFYLTSTLAPASSNFFLVAAASSLLTPSLIGLGAPSTRSLASFKPRLVTSRTALMTLILLAPTSVSTTENSVFSSAGAAPGAAPPATITGAAAAADTPKASSIFLTKSAASRSVSPLISSRIDSTLLAICLVSSSLVCELFCFDRFLHNHGQIPIYACKCSGATPRR